MTVQAIAGVSASSEAVVMTEYPSLAAGLPGRLIGIICESLPAPFGLPRISYLFALPLAPLGLLLYFLQKVFGDRYVLTNRAVQVWTARGQRKMKSVPLSEIDHVEVEQRSGQTFYNAADLRLVGLDGKTILRLSGLKDAGSFRNAIEQAVQARRRLQESVARIEARV